jgi:hypothetical protein
VGKRSDKAVVRQAKVDEYKAFIHESIKQKNFEYKFYGTREQYGLWLLAEREVFREVRDGKVPKETSGN